MTDSFLKKQRDYLDKVYLMNHDSNRNYKYASKTFGCQMNENDSEKIAGLLEEMGYLYEEDFNRADIIFYNTCCVRESAVEKTFGWIGELKKLKQNNKDLIVCITGCMMEQSHVIEKIKRSYRYVDIILGTNNIQTLPERLYKVRTGYSFEKDDINVDLLETEYISRTDKYRAYVTIMRGCNNFCSYCIVPYVRGREISRDPENILNEVIDLANKGYKEITLLGQNVNSYGNDLNKKDYFTRLLYDIDKVKDIKRIRFMTSHPKDLSASLIDAINDLDKVCNYIHLPLQSGSSRILKEMNRHYTKESYLELVKKIRDKIKDIVITSDIIVGFPGETEKDFKDTLDVIQKANFDNSYMFIYSKRKGTKAAIREDVVDPQAVKSRFNRLLKLQNDISFESNKKMLDKTYVILVEGISKNNDNMLTGRTEGNKIVHFMADTSLIGELINVKISKIKSFSLEGILTNE